MTLTQGQETLRLVLDARSDVGEGPVWDAVRGTLWWVDITAGIVHRYSPRDGTHRRIVAGSAVGAVALTSEGELLVALADGLAILDADESKFEMLLEFTPDERQMRCNDGKCDPEGRFWVGRMAMDASAGVGSLMRIDQDLTATTRLPGLAIPNGLGWSPDGHLMYFLDSNWGEVRVHPYEGATGTMGEGRTFVTFVDDGSVPDGLTVDAEGHLWVALWGGGCVVRVDPKGGITGRLDLPVSQVTSCTFGGDDLGDLYITTAREGLSPEAIEREPLAGGLFRCRPGVQGLPSTSFGLR